MEDGSRSLGLFRKRKACTITKFHRTNSVICSHPKEGKTSFTLPIKTIPTI